MDAAKVKQVELWQLKKCDIQARTVHLRWILGDDCWESHECNKPGLQCVQETHCRGNKPKGKRVETTAAVQEVMVETLEYDNGMLIESRFGFVSELTTIPPLSPISRS